jgi:hypothetical protein
MHLRAFLITLLLPAYAWAQPPLLVAPEDIKLSPPLADVPPGEDVIVPLRLREPAPFEGQLFSTDTALRWGFWLRQWQSRYKADVAYERNTCAIRMKHQSDLNEALELRSQTLTEDLRARLSRTEQARTDAEFEVANPGFFSSPGFYYGLGVLTSAALVGLGVWATADN